MVTWEEVATSHNDGCALITTLRRGTPSTAASFVTCGGEAVDLSGSRDTTRKLYSKNALGVLGPLAGVLIPEDRSAELIGRGLGVLCAGNVCNRAGIRDASVTMIDTGVPNHWLRDVWVTDNCYIEEVSGVLLDWNRGLELKLNEAILADDNLLMVWCESHREGACLGWTTRTSSTTRLRTEAVSISDGGHQGTRTMVSTATVEAKVRITDGNELASLVEVAVHISIADVGHLKATVD